MFTPTPESNTMAEGIRDYIITEVAAYLATQGYVSTAGDTIKDLARKVECLDSDLDTFTTDTERSISGIEDRIEDMVVDAITDSYRAKDSIGDMISEGIKESDLNTRLDNVEQKLNKLIEILSNVKSNVGEYE